MCHLTASALALQQAIPNGCATKALPPSQRLRLGLKALAGIQAITDLADEADVSRKFVYRQCAIADRALSDAFAPHQADDYVLFHIPVTKEWLRQLVLGLDRKNVAGFESHQFRTAPFARDLQVMGKAAEKGKERWVLRRLELVSLLKFEKPAVYVSDQLPRMEDLQNAPKRGLASFEEKALKSLFEGEDLITEATPNRIRMMGSLRASKQCLECHQGERGALLGGFSYELLRDPAIALR